jgi:hypothetical protein
VSGRCRGLHHSSVQPGSPQATLRWPPRAALAGGQSHGSHVIVTVPGSHRCWARQASGKPGSPECLTCPISIFKHIIEQLGCGPGAASGCRLDGSAGSIRPSRSPRWSRPYRPGSAARAGWRSSAASCWRPRWRCGRCASRTRPTMRPACCPSCCSAARASAWLSRGCSARAARRFRRPGSAPAAACSTWDVRSASRWGVASLVAILSQSGSGDPVPVFRHGLALIVGLLIAAGLVAAGLLTARADSPAALDREASPAAVPPGRESAA